jgi:hypothetical protein
MPTDISKKRDRPDRALLFSTTARESIPWDRNCSIFSSKSGSLELAMGKIVIFSAPVRRLPGGVEGS